MWDKLFKKKQKYRPETFIDDDGSKCSVDADGVVTKEMDSGYLKFDTKGNITGEVMFAGVRVQVDASIEKLDAAEAEIEAEMKGLTTNVDGDGRVKLEISYITENQLYLGFPEIARNCATLQARGYSHYYIDETIYKLMVEAKEKRDRFNYILSRTGELNTLGKEAEKAGNIELVMELYEQCIELEYPATHSFERLRILYKKQKDTANEIRVIEKAIKVYEIENERRRDWHVKEGLDISRCNFYDVDTLKRHLAKANNTK